MNLDDLSTEQKRKLLLTPAQSKAALQNWIRQFLDLDLPDCTIDPTSNSSPLECLWEIYSKALRNDDPDFSSILVYAAREGVKTLLASIIEVLAVLHLDRSVVHLAARLEQSNKAQGYVTAFFQRPVLRDFITGNAVRQKEFAWWEHPITGEVLTEKEFKAAKQPDGYLYRRNEIVIIVATIQSVNGQHSSLVVEDELDVMQNPLVYEEAKMIPTPYKGKNPITLMVSSRKFAHGLVQKEIDQAEQTGLRIRHWNIYDVTQNCPSSRHRPDLPKVDIAYSEQTLVAITRREYDALPSDRKETFKIDQGYAGCIQNCKMFASCRGRLANKPVVILPKVGQNLLKPISHIQNQFRRNTLDMVKAQMLCFAGSARVLMGDGTEKPIQEVRVGDTVVTHTGMTRRVIETMNRSYSGDMCAIENPARVGAQLLATPEHPFFVNGRDFKPIGEAETSHVAGTVRQPGDTLSMPEYREFSGRTEINYFDYVKDGTHREVDGAVVTNRRTSSCRPIPTRIRLDADFGWILGYYLAEGNLARRRYGAGGPEYCTTVAFASHDRETELHERVRRFARALGLTTSEQHSPVSEHGYQIRIYNSALAPLFRALCGEHCDKKKLHADLIASNREFVDAVLDGFYAGDGTKRQSSQSELTTTSPGLVTQLAWIAASRGLCPRIKEVPKARAGSKQAYRLWYRNPSWVLRQTKTRFKTEGGYNQYRLDRVQRVPFSGTVYNLEVEGDQSYIVDGLAVHNCWKPSTVGMVYPNLDREVHMLTAAEIAFMLDGEEHPPEMTKSELIALFQERGARCHAAQDYGFTHNFVNTTGFRDGNRLFVVDCLAQAELEVEQQIALCDTRIRAWDPTVVGDAENPEAIRKFRKAGYRISAIKKGAGSVVSGIERVRGMIRPAIGLPTVYFLAGDPGVDFLVKSLELYHWKLDAAGNPTGEPDDADDDAPDSFRYLVMSLGMGGVVAPKETPPQPTQAPTAQNWMRQQITQAIGQSIGVDIAPKEGPAVVDFSGGASDGRRGRRGRLFWST